MSNTLDTLNTVDTPIEGEYIPAESTYFVDTDDIESLKSSREFTVVSKKRVIQTRSDILVIDVGCTIEEAVNKVIVDVVLVENAIVTIHGVVVPREYWASTRPKEGTLVEIVCAPKGRSFFRLVAFAALAYFAPYAAGALLPASAAFAVGTLAHFAVTLGIVVIGSLLIDAILPPPELKRDSGEADRIPYLSGVGNRPRKFAPVPRLFGKHRFTPDIAGTSFTELVGTDDGTGDGNDQWITFLVCWGYGPVKLTNLRFGDIPISSYADSEIKIEHSGVYSSATLPLGQSWDITNTLYPTDIHQDRIESPVRRATAASRVTANNPEKVILTYGFPRGLRILRGSGDKEVMSVAITIDRVPIQNNVEGSSTRVLTKTIRKDTQSPVRLVFEDDLSSMTHSEASPTTYKYTLTRVTADSAIGGDDYFLDELVWHSIKSLQYGDPVNFSQGAFTAIRVKADDTLSNQLSYLNADVEAYIPSYNPTTQLWDRLSPSSNPADCIYEILTAGVASARTVTAADIDLVSLKEFWNHCNDNGYRFNHVIKEPASMWDTLSMACRVGFAGPARINSKWGVKIDKANLVPKQMFTPRNSSDYTLSKAYDRIPHAVRVSFSNESLNYVQDEVIAFRHGYDSSSATEYVSMSVPGVVTARHAWEVARFYLVQKIVRPEVHSFKVGIDYLTADRGDLIHLQQDIISVGIVSARIVSTVLDPSNSARVKYIQLDTSITMQSGLLYTARIRNKSNTQVAVNLRTRVGEYNDVELDSTVNLSPAAVSASDLVSIGERNVETIPLIISAIKPQADFSAVIEAVNYNADLYNLGTIPTFQSYTGTNQLLGNIRRWPRLYIDNQGSNRTFRTLPDGTRVTNIIINIITGIDDISLPRIEAVRLRWKLYNSSAGRQEAISWNVWNGAPSANQHIIENVAVPSTDEERERVVAHINANTYSNEFTYVIQSRYIFREDSAVTSEWSPLRYHTVLGPRLRPPTPSNLSITADRRYLSWSVTQLFINAGFLGFRIRYKIVADGTTTVPTGTDDTGSTWVQAHDSGYYTSTTFDLRSIPHRTLQISIRSLNAQGIESLAAYITLDNRFNGRYDWNSNYVTNPVALPGTADEWFESSENIAGSTIAVGSPNPNIPVPSKRWYNAYGAFITQRDVLPISPGLTKFNVEYWVRGDNAGSITSSNIIVSLSARFYDSGNTLLPLRMRAPAHSYSWVPGWRKKSYSFDRPAGAYYIQPYLEARDATSSDYSDDDIRTHWGDLAIYDSRSTGAGYEYAFAKSSQAVAIPTNQKPLNSWGFSQQADVNGLAWRNNAPTLTSTERYLWRSERRIIGNPITGEIIDDNWTEPVIVGVWGRDGSGYEYIFAKLGQDMLPTNQRPLNSWGYERPATVNGLTWHDDAPTLTASDKYLWRSEREIEGTPAAGEVISDNWSTPKIVGAWGEDGEDGTGYEFIYTRTSTDSLSSTLYPREYWAYENPGTSGQYPATIHYYDSSTGEKPWNVQNIWTNVRAGDFVCEEYDNTLHYVTMRPMMVGQSDSFYVAIDSTIKCGTDDSPKPYNRFGLLIQGDSYVNRTNSKYYSYENGAWQYKGVIIDYDVPTISLIFAATGTLQWHREAQTLTHINRYLWRSQRKIIGSPTRGQTGNPPIASTWSTPVIVGEHGVDGWGVENVYARSPTTSILSTQHPDNSWGYDRQGTMNGLVWYDSPPGLTVTDKYLWNSYREVQGNPAAGANVVDRWSTPRIVGAWGEAGEDGSGYEFVYARTTSSTAIPTNQRPLNSWGFDQPTTVNGLTWTDGARSLSSTYRFLWRCERVVNGTPAAGATITANWSNPSIVGEWGSDGPGYEYIFAATNSETLPTNQRPDNTWRYDQPGSIFGLRWYDGAVTLSATKRFLWRSERDVTGTPAAGDAISANWKTPVIVGVFGAPGAGYEFVYATPYTRAIPTNQRPLNSWGYNQSTTVNGLTWHNHAINLTITHRFLWRSEREVNGTPTTGATVSDSWSIPVIVGVWGQDGHGYEFVYARTTSSTAIPTNQRPLNSWGFDQPTTVNGLRWYDNAPSLTSSNRFLWRSEREVNGTPTVGTAVADSWSTPVIVGEWGQDGQDGHGYEFIYTRTNSSTAIPTNQRPLNSWGFDQPTTVNGLAWTDGAPSLTSSNRFLWRSEREVNGTPTVGTAVADSWSTPVIVGVYGSPGPPGTATTTRPPGHWFVSRTSSSWSDSAANAVITAAGLTRIVADRVTQYRGTSWVETRHWSGSSWIRTDKVFDGNILFPGSITADKIAANAITATSLNANVRNAQVLYAYYSDNPSDSSYYIAARSEYYIDVSDDVNNYSALLIMCSAQTRVSRTGYAMYSREFPTNKLVSSFDHNFGTGGYFALLGESRSIDDTTAIKLRRVDHNTIAAVVHHDTSKLVIHMLLGLRDPVRTQSFTYANRSYVGSYNPAGPTPPFTPPGPPPDNTP